jgi:ketosteroid isomerase-like protein
VSQENVELQHRLVEAFNAGDIEAYTSLCDPQVEVHSTFAAVGGAVYHAHDGVRRWWRDLEEAWGSGGLQIQPETYFDLGEYTLAFWTLHGYGSQSGAEVAMPAAAAHRWREGLVVFVKAYAHRAEALSDLGVSHDELEPIDP